MSILHCRRDIRMPHELHDAVLFCGTVSGDHADKFAESGLTLEEAEKVDCCRIKEALGFLECEVVEEIESGDHVIFVGKILHSDHETGKRVYHNRGSFKGL